MTSKFSILSAALAIGTLAALPALAQSATPSAPATPAPAVSGSVQSGVHADVKSQATDEHKAKDKAVKEKTRPQIAEHPGLSGKADSHVKTDSAMKPSTAKPETMSKEPASKDAGSK